MNKLAYDNLKLLDEEYSNTLHLICDDNILSLIEKDDFDTCSKLKSLEYPIYFTYHQTLNLIDYDEDISYKLKMYLLDKIESSLNNLIDYVNDYEEEGGNILSIIDDIYDRVEFVKNNNKHNYFERFIYLFDEMVDGFREARKYLYFTPQYYPLMNLLPGEYYEDDEDTSDEGGSEDGSEDENDDNSVDVSDEFVSESDDNSVDVSEDENTNADDDDGEDTDESNTDDLDESVEKS